MAKVEWGKDGVLRKNVPAETLRMHLIGTLPQREMLLDKWRNGLQLSDVARQAVWVLLSDLVYTQGRRYFGKKQPYGVSRGEQRREWYDLPDTEHRGYDTHTDRILLLGEWLRAYNLHSDNPRSVGWCLTAWKFRFSNFEAVRELRSRGVHVEISDSQHWQVKGYITFKQLRRTLRDKGEPDTVQAMLREWGAWQEKPPSLKREKRMEKLLVFFSRLVEEINPRSLEGVIETNGECI